MAVDNRNLADDHPKGAEAAGCSVQPNFLFIPDPDDEKGNEAVHPQLVGIGQGCRREREQ